MNTCEEVFSGRIDTHYHHNSPFPEERGRYLAHLLARGWARATVCGKARQLAAFAARVDINCEGGVTVAQIQAAADDWMKVARHYFRCDNGPHRTRTRFVNVATNWLRFLDRLRDPECAPVAYADLLAEFCAFSARERELSSATIRRRRHDALGFLAWFEQQHPSFNEVTLRDVDRFLALPSSRPCSRVTIAELVLALLALGSPRSGWPVVLVPVASDK